MTLGDRAPYDVVIVGAGPTGTALATLLGARGRRVALLEMHAETYPLPRAVHVDDEVLRILHEVGVGEEFARISIPGLGLQLIDHDHRRIARFERAAATASGLPQASMFDQPELEVLLRKNLGRHPTVELMVEHEVIGLRELEEGVRVLVRAPDTDGDHVVSELHASYVVGCDGARGITRRTMEVDNTDLGFEQRWLVVDVRSRQPLDAWDGVHQLADHRRAGTFMRVGTDRYRWEFQLLAGETTTDFRDLVALEPLIGAWLGDVDRDGVELLRSVEYTFRARVASAWRRGRVFLAGDAAHLTPPFIGQGLCAGLRDAANLAWKLDRALSAHGDFDVEPLLASYEAERLPHATEMIRRAVLLGRVMTGGGRAGSWLRRVAGPALVTLPSFRAAMLDSATPPLVEGPLVSKAAPPSLRGALLPLVQVADASGAPTWVDRLLGDDVAVLCLATPTGDAHLSAQVVVVDREADGAGPGERHLVDWFDQHEIRWAVVRPDRVVLAAGRTDSDLVEARRALSAVGL